MKKPLALAGLIATPEPDASVIPVEQAVLGAALVGREALPPLLPDEFMLEGHRVLWTRLVAMRAENQTTDLLTAVHALQVAGELEQVGGPAALALMAEAAALHVHTLEYARRVREAATRRRLVGFGAELVASGMTTEQAQVEMSKMPGPLLFDYDPAEVWTGIVDGWKQARMRFGFAPLDDAIGGLYPGDFVVIGGRTSHGKSAFAVAMSIWLAQQGTPTDYVTLEDPVSAIMRRQVSNLTGLVTRRLREGSLSGAEFDVAEEAVAALQQLPLRVVGVEQLGGMEERHLAAYLAVTEARVVIVDHFQQVVTPGAEESRNYGLERILRTFHGEALRTGRVVLLLAQLNREAEARKGPPRLSDLRDCGALEQAARLVLLLYWPHRHRSDVDWHEYEVYIAKYAEGGNAMLPLRFDASTGRFWRRGEERA